MSFYVTPHPNTRNDIVRVLVRKELTPENYLLRTRQLVNLITMIGKRHLVPAGTPFVLDLPDLIGSDWFPSKFQFLKTTPAEGRIVYSTLNLNQVQWFYFEDGEEKCRYVDFDYALAALIWTAMNELLHHAPCDCSPLPNAAEELESKNSWPRPKVGISSIHFPFA